MAFLDAGTPPVYAGFGSMRAPNDIARVAIEAIRGLGRRALVSRGWAGLALIDDRDDCFVVGEVNLQACSAEWPPSCTTAARARDALRTALTPETGARAAAVAGSIRTDGATVATTMLLDGLSRERLPASA